MNNSSTQGKLTSIVTLAIIYMVAGKLGLRMAFVNPSATAVWPPTGIALSALLILGRQVWLGIFLGAFLVNVTTAGSIATSLGIATGNTLEAVAGWYLIMRFANGPKVFNRTRDVFRFSVLAGLVSTTVSATIGVTSAYLGGLASWPQLGTIWLTWWLGDAVGALVITPLLVLWWRGPRLRWSLSQIGEGVILLASIFLIGQIVFGRFFFSSVKGYPLEFLCLPLLIWAAFRFGPREAATAVVIISAIAISGTLAGFGPFVKGSRNEALVLLQVFVGVSTVTSLALAVLVAERKENEEELKRLAATDPTTGLANYRRFMEILSEEVRRSRRTESPFSILLLDLDGMKQVNDRYGHLVGNRALVRLAMVLQHCSRNIDTAARFGGDEFAMILLETDKTEAQQVASRIFERLTSDQEVPTLIVSVGISVYPGDGKSIERLLDAADRALYQAKRGGGKPAAEKPLK